MRRNAWERVAQEMSRIAAREARSPGDRGTVGAALGVSVGANDPSTGEWLPFGQLDLTTFDEGFRLAGNL